MFKSRGTLTLASLLICFLIAGCKVDLYSNLSEIEANQMLAELMSNGITAEKARVGDSFVVRVDDADMATAIAILTSKGLPRDTRASFGSVFQKSGIISSPFEERVRYIYALGEEVAKTLSEIDGVVTARVHVVLPEEPELGQPVKPSSAAVFIKHEPNVDLEFFVPQIRRLVSSAIEGLKYSDVAVILTEAAPVEIAEQKIQEQTVEVLPGLAVREADVGYFWRLVYSAIAVMVALFVAAATCLTFLIVGRRRRSSSRNAVQASDTGTALEPS